MLKCRQRGLPAVCTRQNTLDWIGFDWIMLDRTHPTPKLSAFSPGQVCRNPDADRAYATRKAICAQGTAVPFSQR